ncbi:hypothetical protein RY27_25725 [Litorilinea aerophila]|nr:hypothetical protein RY27_25725 [Litorilinea aerophila]
MVLEFCDLALCCYGTHHNRKHAGDCCDKSIGKPKRRIDNLNVIIQEKTLQALMHSMAVIEHMMNFG